MPGSIFYTIGIGFASGIFIRSFFDVTFQTIALIFLISIGCFAAWYLRGKGKHSALALVAVGALSCALGLWRMDVAVNQPEPLRDRLPTEVSLTGVVVREPDVRARLVNLYVRETETGALLLVSTDRFKDFAYGDRLQVEGTLTEPEAFATDLGRSFNYPGYLRAQGVSQMITFASTTVLERSVGHPFLAALYSGKQAFMKALERTLHEPYAGLGEGVLLGVKRALGEDLEQVFRDVGIIHIVVLSGYNVMIVVVAVTWVLALFFKPRVRLILGLGAIATFALLVGLSATVVRASIMASLLLIARATGRTYAIVRALLLAGMVMLFLNPYLLVYDPGFQLSFLATLGLILLAPALDERFSFVPSFAGAREFFVATVSTQIFVLPLLLYQMGLFSVVAVIVNVLVLPAVPFAMLFTFLTGVVALLSHSLAMVVGIGAQLTLGYIVVVAELFARLPYAAVAVPSFPFWYVVAGYGLLTALVWWLLRQTPTKPEDENEEVQIKVKIEDYSSWTIEEEVGNKKELPFR